MVGEACPAQRAESRARFSGLGPSTRCSGDTSPPAPCGAVDDYPAATRHFVGQVLRAFRAVLVRPHLPPVWLRLHGQRLHKGQNWRAQFGSGSGRRGNNLAGHAWLQFGVSSGKKPPEAG